MERWSTHFYAHTALQSGCIRCTWRSDSDIDIATPSKLSGVCVLGHHALLCLPGCHSYAGSSILTRRAARQSNTPLSELSSEPVRPLAPSSPTAFTPARLEARPGFHHHDRTRRLLAARKSVDTRLDTASGLASCKLILSSLHGTEYKPGFRAIPQSFKPSVESMSV